MGIYSNLPKSALSYRPTISQRSDSIQLLVCHRSTALEERATKVLALMLVISSQFSTTTELPRQSGALEQPETAPTHYFANPSVLTSSGVNRTVRSSIKLESISPWKPKPATPANFPGNVLLHHYQPETRRCHDHFHFRRFNHRTYDREIMSIRIYCARTARSRR